MENKSIHFQLTDINYRFTVSVVDRTVQIDSASNVSADVVMRTTLPKMMALIASGNSGADSLKGIEINGDVNLMHQLHRVFIHLEFDWEDELSQRIGDIPARRLGNLVRWGRRQAEAARESIRDSVRHTLVDEQYLVPEKSRVEKFLNDVDTLQADTDRLDQRVGRLERQLRQ